MPVDSYDDRVQVVERSKLHPHTRAASRYRVESPLDFRNDAERAFRPDNQIDHVTRFEEGVNGIARGVLPYVRERAGDEWSGGAKLRSYIPAEAVHRFRPAVRLIDASLESNLLSIGSEKGEPPDPASHAAEPNRARPRRVGRDHSPERGPGTTRWIGWQPQIVGAGSGVELCEGDRGSRSGYSGMRIDFQRLRKCGEVQHHSMADISATHGAAGAPGDQWHPMFRGP
jgi:hypothetical protein